MSGSFAILALERNDLEGALRVWREGLEQGWMTASCLESLAMGFDDVKSFGRATKAILDSSPRLAVLWEKAINRE